MADGAERNLLFGLLAVQNGLVDLPDLVDTLQAWTKDKSRPLADHLVDRGKLDDDQKSALEALVDLHIKKHDGDATASLGAITPGRSTLESLGAIGDPEIDATILLVKSSDSETIDSVTRSGSFAVGSTTGDGQRFRVLRPHAQGGLGAVFVALDGELNREVALKQILTPYADDPTSRARFLLEAEITGGLEHPGIVPVYGLGSDVDGRPYYAMRFIKGDSLKEAIAAFHADPRRTTDSAWRSLELRRLLRRFNDVCNAIHYAHTRGVLHRDIKPGNVIVGKHGETLVVDWGLAKPLGRSDPRHSTTERALVPQSGSGSAETLPGSALGTPAYMSPEQAAGDLDRLGPSSDVYSLGATLYCLLTGKPPFGGGGVRDIRALLKAVQDGDFASPRTIDPTIDRNLEAVCLKAMATKPEQRYETCRALAEDLDRWAADEPVMARRDPLIARSWRWIRKHRTASTTVVATGLVGLLMLGLAWTREARYSRNLARANRDLGAANQALALAEAETSRWLDQSMKSTEEYFTGIGEEALRGGQLPPALRDKLLQKPLQFYEKLTRELASRPNATARERSLLGRGRSDLARLLAILGRSSDAETAYQGALEVYERLADLEPEILEHQHRLAMAYTSLCFVRGGAGRTAEADDLIRKSIAIYEGLVVKKPDNLDYLEGLAVAWNNLGVILRDSGKGGESAQAHQRAIEVYGGLIARNRDVPEFQDGQAAARTTLGNLLREIGRPKEAIDQQRQAIALQEGLVARYPSSLKFLGSLASSENNLGVALDALGLNGEATAAYRASILHFESLVARQPNVMDYQRGLGLGHASLGTSYYAKGRHVEAVDSFRRGIAIYDQLAAQAPDVLENQDLLASTLTNLGVTLKSMRRLPEATEAHRRAVAIYESLVARNSNNPEFQGDLAGALSNLGSVLQERGQRLEAVEVQRRALGTFETLVRQNPQVPSYQDGLARGHTNLAEVLRSMGQVVEANEAVARAVQVREALVAAQPLVPNYRSRLGLILHVQAKSLDDQGEREAALALFRRAAEQQGIVLDRTPRMIQARQLLERHLSEQARILRQLGRIEEAVSAIRSKADLVRDNPIELYNAACEVAVLIPQAPNPTVAETMTRDALKWLDLAVKAGWSQADHTAADLDLTSLRARPEFRTLLDAMRDRVFPSNPFEAGR